MQQPMPDVLTLSEKQHMVLTEEALKETTLERLRVALLDAFDAVINHQGVPGEVTVFDWFIQYSHLKFKGKTVSLAFYREKEHVSECSNEDSLRAIYEILSERLGVAKLIFDKKYAGPVDFYLVEEAMPANVNEKRKILRKRRDILQEVKSRAKLAMTAKSEKPLEEKVASSEALKKLVLQTRSA